MCTVTGFCISAGQTLVDVGANVGMYSLCAARFRGVKVYAFEPESQNYAILNQNIHRNGLQNRSPPIAWRCRTGPLRRPVPERLHPGGSCHTFGERPRRRPAAGGDVPTGKLRRVGRRLIGVGAVQPPDHLKIDVDGIEPKIISGAEER